MYTRMPFGLINAPAYFQRMMDRVLGPNKAYIDDIIHGSRVEVTDEKPWGSDVTQHLAELQEIFDKLTANGLTVSAAKMHLCWAEVQHLGHTVSAEGVKPQQSKVDAIVKMATPTTKGELMTFLGMAGYYRSSVPAFSSVAEPLRKLLVKNAAWDGVPPSSFRWTR